VGKAGETHGEAIKKEEGESVVAEKTKEEGVDADSGKRKGDDV
jgi:hypothetical protein